jgi:prevent-host-death family protein
VRSRLCYIVEHMGSQAGIRELRQELSRYIDRVKAGEVIDVTEHGRLVARLTPAADLSGSIAALEERGLTAHAPSLDFASLAPPPPIPPGRQPPSAVLAEERATERF